MRYKTPKALEQAVKAAAKKSGRDTNKAIAGFYHDRFLCRVFAADEHAFVLKGGQSMLAKIPDVRETRDIDLLGRTANLDEALEGLKKVPITFFSVWCSADYRSAVPRRVGARLRAISVRTGRMTASAPAMPQF